MSTVTAEQVGATGGPAEASSRSKSGRLTSAAGIVAILTGWQLLAMTIFAGTSTVPAPSDIVRQFFKDGPHFYWSSASVTLLAGAKGWVWGNLLAVGLALVVLVIPKFEKPLMQLGVTSYCLPIVAIGPVFAIVFKGETPKVILAAMSVFFTTLVGALVGLRSVDPTCLDVIHAYGGGRVHKLLKVRLRASLPSLFSALRIAAPAAVLGAIIGEYLGAEHGLGVAMINAQQSGAVTRTWTISLVATAAAGIAYGLTAYVGRLLTPWAPRVSR
jgi:ABC-type nitrate/sulfonate/bicarbonate transport system permease component